MDPTRLLDTDEDRFETRLLGAARDDAPPRGALNRAEVALGFGVSATMMATAAATSTAKAATAHLGAAHAVAGQVGAVSVLKWLGVGLVSGVVVTGGLRYGVTAALSDTVTRPSTTTEAPAENRKKLPGRSAARHTHPEAVAETLAEPAAEAVAEAQSTIAGLPAPVPSLAPSESDVRRTPKPIAPTAAVRPSPTNALSAIGVQPEERPQTPSLSAELSVLERARRALLQQRPDVVLRELDTYTRTRNTGVFDAEAEMLAIEAFLQQGNVGLARTRAARSLERAPRGPHAARLREIVAAQNP